MNTKTNLIESIARVSRLMRRGSHESEDLSHMGHYVLRIVMEHDGITATELAELAGVRPPSVTEAINRLEKSGYVIRKKDDTDSRVKRIYITEKTKEQIEKHTRVKEERNERMLSCLTEEEIASFLAICDKLCIFLESEPIQKGE